MTIPTQKLAAIFQNPQSLKHALDALTSFGFEPGDISVLIKSPPEAQDEVRTYGTALYPPVAETPGLSPRILGQQDISLSSPLESKLIEHQLSGEEGVSLKDPTALRQGALTGGLLGLIAGSAALLIPGIGPVLAAGPILAAVTALATGAALGTAAGTLIGLLNDEGLPDDKVEVYRQAFEAGKGIIFLRLVNASEFKVVSELLERYHPERMELI